MLTPVFAYNVCVYDSKINFWSRRLPVYQLQFIAIRPKHPPSAAQQMPQPALESLFRKAVLLHLVLSSPAIVARELVGRALALGRPVQGGPKQKQRRVFIERFERNWPIGVQDPHLDFDP